MRKVVPVPKEFDTGDRFVALGTLPLCEDCFLRERCKEYKKGWIYEVKAKVGMVEHDCKIHGKVVMGEVEEVGVPLVIPKRLAIEGVTVEYTPTRCGERNCPFWKDCSRSIGDRVKIKVREVLEDVECPKGYSLVKVIGLPVEVVRKKRFKKRHRGR
ncbi:MAG: hypothetical protein GXO07_04675 [Crenarchaeota archaeon]|nr:hypothetical protein [Thermoproteota archaeon]